MKLRTIWTMPAATFREKLERTWVLVLIKLVHHLPAELKYRVYIDVGVANIPRDQEVPAALYVDILKKMDAGRRRG
jgi:hypothetical protein